MKMQGVLKTFSRLRYQEHICNMYCAECDNVLYIYMWYIAWKYRSLSKHIKYNESIGT